jgi:hypothetical protein
MYQMAVKDKKNFAFQGPSKYTQSEIFGLMYHLATRGQTSFLKLSAKTNGKPSVSQQPTRLKTNQERKTISDTFFWRRK